MKTRDDNTLVRRTYRRPRLEQLGNVEQLTRGSAGSQGDVAKTTQPG